MKSLFMKSSAFLLFMLAVCPNHFAQRQPEKIQLPPRRLSQEQKASMKRELAQIANKLPVRIACPQTSEDSWEYAKDFAEVLNGAGWKIVDAGDAGTPVRRVRFAGLQQKGVFLLVSTKEKSTPVSVQKVLSVLKSNGIPITFESSDDLPKGVFEIRVLYRENETPYTY
jgi:hypothetical protein